MEQSAHEDRSRLPKADAPRRQISLRLTEDEREELEALAKKDGRSRSGMAHRLYMRGLAEIKNEMQKGGES
ncbi:ribbon-helix-helix protein, CopG family [Salmonella enterica]